MTDNVVIFNGLTKLDLPPERILKSACDVNLQQVIVIGELANGDIYLAGSTADMALLNIMLDRAKRRALDLVEENVGA